MSLYSDRSRIESEKRKRTKKPDFFRIGSLFSERIIDALPTFYESMQIGVNFLTWLNSSY